MLLSFEYLAGFFDADGGVTIRRHFENPKHTFSMNMYVSQTQPEVLQKFQERFKGSVGGPYKNGPNSKPIYKWHCYERQAENALRTLLPFLIVKKPQAELALELRGTVTRSAFVTEEVAKTRLGMFERMAQLNKRGVK